ncbi:MAG: YqjK family protein [Burkholderiales bacterium]
MTRVDAIRARRQGLVLRAAAERDDLAAGLMVLATPLRVADAAVSVGQTVRAHSGLVLVAVAIFVIVRPRRAFALARSGFFLWRTGRWVGRSLGLLV